MTEQELRESLHRLVPEELRQTHEAFLRAVESAEEERPVKKHLHLIPILVALILALAATTAWALANRSSVTDLNASKRLTSHLVTLDQDYEDERIKLSFNDAAFDGQTLSLAMDAENKKPDEPVFVQVRVEATDAQGYPLEAEVDSYGGGLDFFSGSLFPSLTPQPEEETPWYVDITLLDDPLPTGTVHWNVTVRVLTPNWPLEAGDEQFNNTTTFAQQEQLMQHFREAYEHHRIRVMDGAGLAEYGAMLPCPQNVDVATWSSMRLWELLVHSGAFDLYATVSCAFDAAAGEDAALNITPAEAWDTANMQLQVESLHKTFQQVSIHLRGTFKDETLTKEACTELLNASKLNVYLNGTQLAVPTVSSKTVYQEEAGHPYAEIDMSIPIPDDIELTHLTFEMADADGKADGAPPFTVRLNPT